MAEELSAADRSALAAEQGPVTMAVGGLMVFAGAEGLAHDRLLERLSSRLHLIPRYRQRLQAPAPGGLAYPVWVDDAGFDLGWHVRRAALPAPGGPGELAAFAGAELSRRLDRSRPLWELTVVEGLAGGRAAVLAKMHHALVDGVAAVDIGLVLLDPTPEPLELPAPEEGWSPRRYDRRRHWVALAASPALRARRRVLEALARGVTRPTAWAEDVRGAGELLVQLARTRPQAPATPLNRPIGPNRRFALHRAELIALKRAAKAHGATVNDAILAAVAGALRTALGPQPARLVALVPVSVRREGEEGGNRMSTVLADLPTDVADPIGRLRAVHEEMAGLKASAAVRAGALLLGISGAAPPVVSSTLARATQGMRAFNLVVSNVPGPQQALFLNGERLLEVYPAVPLNPATQGLSVGVLSYDGGVFFGLLGDRDLDPPVATLREALVDALEELGAA